MKAFWKIRRNETGMKNNAMTGFVAAKAESLLGPAPGLGSRHRGFTFWFNRDPLLIGRLRTIGNDKRSGQRTQLNPHTPFINGNSALMHSGVKKWVFRIVLPLVLDFIASHKRNPHQTSSIMESSKFFSWLR